MGLAVAQGELTLLFGIKTQKLARLLRAIRNQDLVVDVFTIEDMGNVPASPGSKKACPPPTFPSVKVVEIGDYVRLELEDGSIVDVTIDRIGGIRTKNLAEVAA